MKFIFEYIDEPLIIANDKVMVLEVLHKKYFVRIIQDFIAMNMGNQLEYINVIDEHMDDVKLENRLLIIMDFFHIELNSKKNLTALYKLVQSQLSAKEILECTMLYKKICSKLCHLIENIDLPLYLNEDFDVISLLRLFKIGFIESNNILENLLLLLDIEKIFHIHEVVILINVKQLLDLDEIKELEKYAIYNKISLLLIDSYSYGETNEYESKLLIDSDLSEIVI